MKPAVQGHLWTLKPFLGYALRPVVPTPSRALFVDVPDTKFGTVRLSGRLAGDEDHRALAVIVHGLGGSSTSYYAQLAALAAERAGMASLRLNLRGADQLGEDFYHAGLTSDLHATLKSPALARFETIYLLGYSLGGHLVLRYLAERPETRLGAAAVVCAPVDLAAGAREIDKPGRFAYRRNILRSLKATYREVAARRDVALPVDRVADIDRIFDWDDQVVAPRHGFEGASDYYARVSAWPGLPEIRTPTLFVASENDPMVPIETVRPRIAETKWFTPVVTPQGGHVGFPPDLDLGLGSAGSVADQALHWMKAAAVGAMLVLTCACGKDGPATTTIAAPERAAGCPVTQPAPRPLPNVNPARETLSYWLERASEAGDLDEVLMNREAIRIHNLALRTADAGKPLGQVDLLDAVDRGALLAQVNERLAYMNARGSAGTYVDGNDQPLSRVALGDFETVETLPAAAPEWRLAKGLISLRCGPSARGLYTSPPDPDFDRNVCSTIRSGEPLQLLGRWSNGMWLARTPYALGWINSDAPLSEPMTQATIASILQGRERPLSRRALLEAAFAFLGGKYGWAGRGGGHDCSRFLLDLFSQFGIELPRHSGRQAFAGTFSIDVSTLDNNQEKLLLIEASARRGIVLLQLPGHIMLYLGKTEDGVPMVMHAFSEFLTQCPHGEGEIVNRTDEIAVSDLSLGAGTSRTDFLNRITRIAVFGKSPGAELAGSATLRPPAPAVFPPKRKCDDTTRTAIFRSPSRPHPGQPLRVVMTASDDPESATLAVRDPNGRVHSPEVHRLGAPPFTQWVELAAPMPGKWMAVLADGPQILACEQITVFRHPAERQPRTEAQPTWQPRWRWEEDTENLFAAFVEQLFIEPSDPEQTWPDLKTLTHDPARNLLYDHRFVGEDQELELKPDCADLPYFLRALFAWKARLPFGFRECTRGSATKPPVCNEEPVTNLVALEAADDLEAAQKFFRKIANTVHSASARVVPQAEASDVYPVAISRRTLKPGTVFADPYGHLLVVARWQAQTVHDYGLLIGADAQPDGTVGRRRFWRGSFLFTPDTRLVGAGFKAWRPLRFDRENGVLVASDNDTLRRTRRAPRWSRQQYRGDADRFYQRVEQLINPRPLDSEQMQLRLIDALAEVIARRVVSVENGEAFVKSRLNEPIEMPKGYRIFETIGPWEDYSTPSRDMRLLISMDAVTGFPARVAQDPVQYGLDPENARAGATRVRDVLERGLKQRSFEYTKSDGTRHTLTLHDAVSRSKAFEMAYNPNDCVEIRWGAPEESQERSTCVRRAPPEQQERMKTYRPWFAARERPPR